MRMVCGVRGSRSAARATGGGLVWDVTGGLVAGFGGGFGEQVLGCFVDGGGADQQGRVSELQIAHGLLHAARFSPGGERQVFLRTFFLLAVWSC